MKKPLLQNSKLFNILATFDQNTCKSFSYFIQSPYFNRRKDLVRLYEILQPLLAKERTIDSLDLIRKLYPSNHKSQVALSPVDSTRLRNAFSKLLGLAEDFLVQEHRHEKIGLKERHLIEALMLKKQYNHARARLSKALKKVNSLSIRNKGYYEGLYLLKEVEFHLDIIEKNRSANIESDAHIEAFELYFLSNIFRHYCASFNRSKALNYKYSPRLDTELSAYIFENTEKMPAAVLIYQKLFLLLNGNTVTDFFEEIENTLFNHWQEFDSHDLRQITAMLINECNWEIRKGRLEFLRKKFELFNKTIGSGIWNDGLYFSAHLFCQVIQNALENNEVATAKKFLDSYKKSLNPIYLEDIVNLSQAFISFAEKDYDQTHFHLNNYSLKEDFYYKLIYKVLLIKLFYEKKEFLALSDALNSFRVFLSPSRNNDWSQDFALACKAFLKVTSKLSKAAFQKNGKAQMLAEIEKTDDLFGRVWLLEKANELP